MRRLRPFFLVPTRPSCSGKSPKAPSSCRWRMRSTSGSMMLVRGSGSCCHLRAPAWKISAHGSDRSIPTSPERSSRRMSSELLDQLREAKLLVDVDVRTTPVFDRWMRCREEALHPHAAGVCRPGPRPVVSPGGALDDPATPEGRAAPPAERGTDGERVSATMRVWSGWPWRWTAWPASDSSGPPASSGRWRWSARSGGPTPGPPSSGSAWRRLRGSCWPTPGSSSRAGSSVTSRSRVQPLHAAARFLGAGAMSGILAVDRSGARLPGGVGARRRSATSAATGSRSGRRRTRSSS